MRGPKIVERDVAYHNKPLSAVFGLFYQHTCLRGVSVPGMVGEGMVVMRPLPGTKSSYPRLKKNGSSWSTVCVNAIGEEIIMANSLHPRRRQGTSSRHPLPCRWTALRRVVVLKKKCPYGPHSRFRMAAVLRRKYVDAKHTSRATLRPREVYGAAGPQKRVYRLKQY